MGSIQRRLAGGHAGDGKRHQHGHHEHVPGHRRHDRPGSRRIFPQRGAATYRDLRPGVHRHIHSGDSSSDHNISADSLLCRPDTKSHIADHPASRSRVNFRDRQCKGPVTPALRPIISNSRGPPYWTVAELSARPTAGASSRLHVIDHWSLIDRCKFH